jgi:hypothetical protein
MQPAVTGAATPAKWSKKNRLLRLMNHVSRQPSSPYPVHTPNNRHTCAIQGGYYNTSVPRGRQATFVVFEPAGKIFRRAERLLKYWPKVEAESGLLPDAASEAADYSDGARERS